nr:cytochrome c oxidase subunit 2 [Parantropora penelope]
MSGWSQVLFQESLSPSMQLLSLFHDYSLGIIVLIVTFVTGVAISMVSNILISDSSIVTIVEVVWTILPVVVLLFLVVPSLQILYFMEENDPYMTLKIMGHQWYWSYEYMDLGIEFDSYLLHMFLYGEYRLLDVDHRVIVPVGKDVRGLISAADVLHCWALPSLGVKADAVPGRLNQVFFNVFRSCVFFGQCSEICGANHSFMPIGVESLSCPLFLVWCSGFDYYY